MTQYKDWVLGLLLHLPKQWFLLALSSMANMADSSMLQKDRPSNTASLTHRVARRVSQPEVRTLAGVPGLPFAPLQAVRLNCILRGQLVEFRPEVCAWHPQI